LFEAKLYQINAGAQYPVGSFTSTDHDMCIVFIFRLVERVHIDWLILKYCLWLQHNKLHMCIMLRRNRKLCGNNCYRHVAVYHPCEP